LSAAEVIIETVVDDGHHHTNLSAAYHVLMLALSFFAIAALAIETIAQPSPAIRAILGYADLGVCALFVFDFLLSLWHAPHRLKYLTTWGWLDAISCVPAISATRWIRVARIVRVVRVLRGVRATREIGSALLHERAKNTVLAATLIAGLLIVTCSIAVLHFETTRDANIKSAEDALWWAFATVTTVGYGDRYPLTSEGRVVAAILMCAGVGLFGTLSGFLASWFLGGPAQGNDLAAIREELAVMRQLLEDQREALSMRMDE
jgi:voltage-gated potassium channel